MHIDYPQPGAEPQMKALWKEAFGDSDALIDSFFRTGFSYDKSRTITIDGCIAAALYWFDVTLLQQKYAYLYAVATGKEYRGQGLCRKLIADTHSLLRDAGYLGCLLVPGEPELAGMYEKMGYRYGTSVDEFMIEAGSAVPLRQLDANEYASLRRTMLPPGGAVQEGNQLAYLGSFSRFYKGENWLACGMVDNDTFLCAELLGNRAAAPGITAALGCTEGRFRAPGNGRDYTMYFPLAENAIPPTYFGLALD